MFCLKCGTQLDDGALFCPMCGTKVVPKNNNANQNVTQDNSNNKTENETADIELNKIEPKQIKTVTEEEKKQNAEEVKGMFFKKKEVSQELIDELNEAEKDEQQHNVFTSSDEQAISENTQEAKKDSVMQKMMGKVSDKDLDKPVYKTKVVIFGVIALAVMLVGTIVTISGVRIRANSNYSEEMIEDADKYVKYEIKDDEKTKKKDNKKNGWIGDYYYEDGKKVKSTWAQYGEDWYYLDKNGDIVKSDWVEDPPNSNKWYYADANGKMLKGKYEFVDGVAYYFQSDGLLLTNGVTPDGQHQMGPDGKPIY